MPLNEDPEIDRLVRLAADHELRLSGIDPRVAPASSMAGRGVFIVSGENGALAAGTIQEQRYDEGDYEALWGALHRYILHVRVAGPDPVSVFDGVIGGLLNQVDAAAVTDVDRAVALTWPSLDTAFAAPLVRHGFAPLTSLVVKELHEQAAPLTRPTVRPARSDDLDWLADQARWLHRFEVELGVLPERPGLRARLRAELAEAIASDTGFVLIASVNGTPVGFVHGQVPHDAWIERQLSMKPAGYLSRLFVEPPARRKSVGRSLIAAAHSVLREQGAKAVLLHHSLHNPLAAPLWAEMGYRPVLTTWTMGFANAPHRRGQKPTVSGGRRRTG